MKKSLYLILIAVIFFSTSTDIFSKKLSNIELGKRYLKLSNTYRLAQNYIKAEDALQTAQNYIFLTNSKYWKATVYEYYANIQYDMGNTHTALLYYYKAYKIHLLMIRIYDGSDDALFRLIIERFPGIWNKYISDSLHKQKIQLKVKLNQKNSKLKKELLAKRFIKLANTYMTIYQSNSVNEYLSKAESFLNSAEKSLGNSTNKYWDAAVDEQKGYIEYLLSNVDESKTDLYSAYRIYRNLIMLLDGSDDAVYDLINNLWPGSGLTNPEIKTHKSLYKLQKAFGKKNYHPNEEG